MKKVISLNNSVFMLFFAYSKASNLLYQASNYDLNSIADPVHIGDHINPTNNVTIEPYSVNFNKL